jgi:ribosome-binding protein aMBF1 (putative translation factor)
MALVRVTVVRTADGDARRWNVAFLLPRTGTRYLAMSRHDDVLSTTLGLIARADRDKRHARPLRKDRVLQELVAELVAARTAAGLTQEEVGARMGTPRSVVSRLESGAHTRPTLSTIEKYALAVGAAVEVRLRVKR